MGLKLSEHFTLGELCKTSVNSLDGNIPSHEEEARRGLRNLEERRAHHHFERVQISRGEQVRGWGSFEQSLDGMCCGYQMCGRGAGYPLCGYPAGYGG